MADEDEAGTREAETPPELSERRFAENLRAAREDKGVSQVKLAQEMAARGWPWRQQTVTRVESGQRMVRLGEALAVAEILDTSVVHLTASTRETGAVSLLTGSTSKAKHAYKQIAEWTQTLLFAQRQLRTTATEAERAGYYDSSLVREVVADAAEVLRLTPEHAISEGRDENGDIHEPDLATAADKESRTVSAPEVVPLVRTFRVHAFDQDQDQARDISAALREGSAAVLDLTEAPKGDVERWKAYAGGTVTAYGGSMENIGPTERPNLYLLPPTATKTINLTHAGEQEGRARGSA